MTAIELTQQELFDVQYITQRRIDYVDSQLTSAPDDDYWQEELKSAKELLAKLDKAVKVTLTSL